MFDYSIIFLGYKLILAISRDPKLSTRGISKTKNKR